VMPQLAAARLAGVDRLRFHTVTQAGVLDFESAAEVPDGDVAGMLSGLEAAGHRWGVSDGN